MSVISVSIEVNELDSVFAAYDRIEVHRSQTGIDGIYTEITVLDGPTSAVVQGTEEAPFSLSGLTLVVLVDSISKEIVFTGTNPLPLGEVLSQIEAVVPGIAAEFPEDSDQIQFESPTKGTGSSLWFSATMAALVLGVGAAKISGKASRLIIVEGTSRYDFKDLDGDVSNFYKVRYSSSTTSVASTFSTPFEGFTGTVVPQEKLSIAKVSLVTGEGKPVSRRDIRFIPLNAKQVDGGFHVIPGFDANVVVETNERGLAEINLLRGVTYRVFIEGTSYGREFVVPDQEDFDLLSILGTAPDPFDIVQAPAKAIKVTI